MSTSSGALFRHQLNKIQNETNRDHRLLVATHRGKHISERNPKNGPILIVIEIIMNDSIIILLIYFYFYYIIVHIYKSSNYNLYVYICKGLSVE